MGLNSLGRSAGRRRLRLARIVAGSWCRSVRCGRNGGQSIVHPQRAIATRACCPSELGLFSAVPWRSTISRERAACTPLHQLLCSLRYWYRSCAVYFFVFRGLRLSPAPPPFSCAAAEVSLILSISASTHLMLSLFTGAAGALAAARDANAASAGICADPYLCCCPGRSFDADDAGRVTDKVNGGCEVCCRGWKCVWWMRSDDGFAT